MTMSSTYFDTVCRMVIIIAKYHIKIYDSRCPFITNTSENWNATGM